MNISIYLFIYLYYESSHHLEAISLKYEIVKRSLFAYILEFIRAPDTLFIAFTTKPLKLIAIFQL